MVNRGLCSSIGLHRFRLFVLLGRRSGDVSSMFWRMRGRIVPRRTILLANSRARSCPATLPCAPMRPARDMSGSSNRQVRCFRECKEALSPRQTVLLAPCLARLSSATPPCASTRPARGMSGFWTRQIINCKRSALRSWLLTCVATPIYLCKPVACMSFHIDPQGSVCTGCRTGCRVSARVD